MGVVLSFRSSRLRVQRFGFGVLRLSCLLALRRRVRPVSHLLSGRWAARKIKLAARCGSEGKPLIR
jgi:hypothetical protein